MTEALAALLLLAGAGFCLVAGIGILRLPDVFSRMHAATKAGTLGLALICLGVILVTPSLAKAIEALVVLVFMLVSAPVGAHLIGRAAFRTRAPIDPRTGADEGAEEFR